MFVVICMSVVFYVANPHKEQPYICSNFFPVAIFFAPDISCVKADYAPQGWPAPPGSPPIVAAAVAPSAPPVPSIQFLDPCPKTLRSKKSPGNRIQRIDPKAPKACVRNIPTLADGGRHSGQRGPSPAPNSALSYSQTEYHMFAKNGFPLRVSSESLQLVSWLVCSAPFLT